jgi:hypothetical protein
MKGVFLVLLPLMLLFTGICEAQMPDPGHIITTGDGGRTGSSDPGQTDPGYDYPPPGVEQAPSSPGTSPRDGAGTGSGDPSYFYPDSTPPPTSEPSIPEPATTSLFLFGITAALALRRRS